MTYMKFLIVIISTLELSNSLSINNVEQIVTKNVITPRGCVGCAYYRCPENTSKCLLGAVPDSCECCPTGRCAKLEDETCWNSSITHLPIESRNEGFCARNYLCQLRTDLHDTDKQEAVCVCIEQSPVCGSNNRTYSNACQLGEEAMRNKNLKLKVQHSGPCPTRPWITSPLENIVANIGQRVALNCEARGFPTPNINWEFYSNGGSRVFKLPNDEHGGTVHTRDGPESHMRTSWLQLAPIIQQYSGTYQCIANNAIGEASTSSYVNVI